MPPIKKLPPKVQSALQTGVTIADTSRCVLELVQNSLDAGATSVTVNINLKTFNILVTDNGLGLTQSDLTDVGKRYMTSKCHSLHDFRTQAKYYGFRGEALASIRETCRTLTITSKAKWSPTSLCKVFINGADTDKVEESEWVNDSHGTTVTVEDFLYNQPIRRNRINPALEMEKIRKNLLPIALINYKVSIILKNDITNKVVLESQASETIDKALQKLCETKASKELVSITAAMKKFQVSGYVSKLAEISSRYQFVYVNKHYIKRNKIHTFLNKCLAKSFYFKGISHKRLSKAKNFTNDIVPECKNINAVFIINIECPLIQYDICFSPEKTIVEFKNWPTVLECIEKAIGSFFNEETKTVNCSVLNEESKKHKNRNKLVEQVIEKLKKTTHKKIKQFNDKSYIEDNNNLNRLFKKPECKMNYFVAGNSLKNESENPFTNSMERKQIVSRKKRKFTDHVITESEMDETPYEQNHKKLKLNNRYNLQNRRSLLPVVSQVFYKSNIHEIESVLKVLKANKKSLNMSSDYKLCENNSNCFKNKKRDCITKVNIRRKVGLTVDFSFNSSVEKIKNDRRNKLDIDTARPFLKIPNSNISNADFRASDTSTKKNKHTVKKHSSDYTVTLNSTQLQYRDVKFHNKNIGLHNVFQSPVNVTNHSHVEFNIKNPHSDKIHTSHLYSKERISLPLHKRHNKRELFTSKVSNNSEMYGYCSSIKETKFNYISKGYSYSNSMRKQKENAPSRNKIIVNNHHGIYNSESKLKYITKNIYNETRHLIPENKTSSVFCSYTSQTFSPFNKNIHRKDSVKSVVGYNADNDFLLFCKPQEHLLFEESLQPEEELTFKDAMYSPYFENIRKLTPHLKKEKLFDFQPLTITTKDKNNISGGLRKMNRELNKSPCIDEDTDISKKNLETDQIYSNRCFSTVKENVLKQDSLFLTHMLRDTVIIVDLNSPIKETVQQENKTINKSNEHKWNESSDIYSVNIIHNSCNTAKNDESNNYNCQREEYMLPDTESEGKNDSTEQRQKAVNISKQEEIDLNPQTLGKTDIQNESSTTMVHELFVGPSIHRNTKTMSSTCEASKHVSAGENSTENNRKLSLLSPNIYLSSDSGNKMGNMKETTESIFTPFTNESACNSQLLDEVLLSSLKNNKGNEYLIHPIPTLPNYKTSNIRESKDELKFSPVNILHSQSHFNSGENKETDSDEERKLMFGTMPNIHQLYHNNKANYMIPKPEDSETCTNKVNKTRVKIIEDNKIKSCNKESCDNIYTSPLDDSQWLKQTLPNGVSIYVHSKTGMSSYFTPVSVANKYLMKKRHWFVPKGSSPLLNYLEKEPKEVRKLNDYEKSALKEAVFVKADIDELSSIKWKGCKPKITGSEDILSKLICEAKLPDDVTKLMQDGKPVIFNKLIYNLQSFTKSYVFTCDSFLTAKVVGQVDCKFIAVMIKDNRHGELLVLLDQHAVDERIQFEKLIADYKGNNNQVMMSNITSGICITLSKAELQLLSHFKTHFEHSGLQIAVSQNEVTVTSVPTCLYNRSMKEGRNQSNSVLKNLTIQLIKEELECLQETKGVGGSLPNVIHTIVSYEACRGAVKFGDKLSIMSAENLIRQLAQCNLPFQCAHGRPVLAPLVSFDNIHYEITNLKPNLKRLKLICNDKNTNC